MEFDYPAIVRRSRQTVDRLVKGLDLLFERFVSKEKLASCRTSSRELFP